MAEGGYDPETTNPFDPHGGDDDDTTPLFHHKDDDDDTSLFHHRDEKGGTEMKHRAPFRRHPPGYSPKSSTSTSGKHETSFIDTPSGKVYVSVREQEMEKIEGKIKERFPNANWRLFKTRMDEYGRVFIKLLASNSKEYLLIDMNGEMGNLKKIRNASKTLKNALGMTVEEVVNSKIAEETEVKEKAEARVKELLKKIRNASKTLKNALGMTVEEVVNSKIAEETEVKEKAEARVKELQEQRENAFPQDRERIDAEIEREQAVANEAERNIEREETRLSLRERIKAIFKKYGFTAFAVATAIGTVIGVIVSNLKAGMTKLAKGVGNGLKELGKKLGEILPGMIGAIASFIFRTAGEVIGFLAKNAWLLVVGLVLLAVEQFKKRSN